MCGFGKFLGLCGGRQPRRKWVVGKGVLSHRAVARKREATRFRGSHCVKCVCLSFPPHPVFNLSLSVPVSAWPSLPPSRLYLLVDLPQEPDFLLQRLDLPLQVQPGQGGLICLLQPEGRKGSPRHQTLPLPSPFRCPLLGLGEQHITWEGWSWGLCLGGLPSPLPPPTHTQPLHPPDLSIGSEVALGLQPQVGFVLEPGVGGHTPVPALFSGPLEPCPSLPGGGC